MSELAIRSTLDETIERLIATNASEGQHLDTYIKHAIKSKDRLIDGKNGYAIDPARSLSVPYLPAPQPKSLFDSNPADNLSVIAIIGAASITMAKLLMDPWSSLYQQASLNMQAAVGLAPVVAEAVTSQYNAQADATSAEATMALNDGLINLSFGVFCIGSAVWAGYNSYLEGSKVGGNIDAAEGAEQGQQAAGQVQQAQQQAEQQGIEGNQNARQEVQQAAAHQAAAAAPANPQVEEQAIVAAEGGGEPAPGQGRQIGGMTKFTTFMSHIYQGFIKTQAVAQSFGMMAQGGTGINDHTYKSQIADKQRLAGQFDAYSKQLEMYAQFYNQAFGRTDDLRQGTQQNFDLAMQVLKSATDTITQALMSQRI